MLAKFKKKYIGDWDFYQKYLLLANPMILQNAITNLVSFLDNIMVGQLGTEQMSGRKQWCRIGDCPLSYSASKVQTENIYVRRINIAVLKYLPCGRER